MISVSLSVVKDLADSPKEITPKNKIESAGVDFPSPVKCHSNSLGALPMVTYIYKSNRMSAFRL